MATKKKQIQFRTAYNHPQDHVQISDPDSVTIPGQSFTIQQLLLRQKQGIPMDIFYHPEYDPNPSLDGIDREQFARMDLTDREAVISAQAERLKRLTNIANSELELLKAAQAEQEKLKRDDEKSKNDDANPKN